MPWHIYGLPGRSNATDIMDTNKRFTDPTVRVILFEDNLFAPVRKFSKTHQIRPEPATPDDLANFTNTQNVLSTPFGRIDTTFSRDEKYNIEAQSLGRLFAIQDVKLRETEYGEYSRKAAIDKGKAFCSQFIAIDGELWMRLQREPRIVYQRELRLVDNGDDGILKAVITARLGTEQIESGNPLHFGHFSASERENFEDFITTTYPQSELITFFDNLEVSLPEVFDECFEAEDMRAVAFKVISVINNMPYHDHESTIELRNDLAWEIIDHPNNSGVDYDRVAKILQQILPAIKNESYTAFVVENVLKRWELRQFNFGSIAP